MDLGEITIGSSAPQTDGGRVHPFRGKRSGKLGRSVAQYNLLWFAAAIRTTLADAGDNGAARKAVLELARAIGIDAVDGGPLKNARYLEPLAFLNVQLSWVLGNGLGERCSG